MIIEEKDKIKVEYEGSFENGDVFDSTSAHGGEPLEFIVGYGMLVPGFEKAVIGMKQDEEKEILLNPEEAYGQPKPEYIQKVPKDNFPPEAKEGMQIGIPTQFGHIPAVIKTIGEDFVELDMNHPLAGKNLKFKIKIVSVEKGPFDLPKHEHSCSCGEDCEDSCSCGDEDDCSDKEEEH